MGVIEEVKDRTDIVEVIGQTVRLKKSGKNYTGFCPFHPNTRTPAFVVFTDTGTWRCFGACNEGGDVYRFLMKKEGWDFPQALRYLAERAGVALEPRSPGEDAQEEAKAGLRALLEAAATYYRNNLLHAAAVLSYLHGRGLQDSTLESFGIGYAVEGWDATSSYLLQKGYELPALIEAGLLIERETGGHYDRFRNRIMIPIRDARGKIAGFGARAFDSNDQPKFLNSPQTALFDKGRLLYGLDKAGKPIRAADQAVVVEGYLDVLALHQAGYQNVVSPMGTALTAQQLRALKRYSRNIVLALDADAAGDRATLRGLTVAREAMDREPDPVFDSRGLVRHEGRLDADIRVISLPGGTDPDELVTEDPAGWATVLNGAKPVVEYVMDVLIAGQDLNDAKAKAQIARQVIPLIEDVADPVEREAYRQSLARKLKLDERSLLGLRSSARRVKRGAQEIETPSISGTKWTAAERFCLGLLLRDPELTYWIDRRLHSLELEGLSALDFYATDSQIIFQALRSALAQVDEEPSQHWRSILDGSTLAQAMAIADQVDNVNFDRPRVVETISADFLRLRKRRVESMLEQLSYQQQAVQESGEPGDQIRYLAQEAQHLTTQKRRLEAALGGRI